MGKIAFIPLAINPQDKPAYTDNILRVDRLSALSRCPFSRFPVGPL
jgi:hypothetical protein